jgi:hypothetical protein
MWSIMEAFPSGIFNSVHTPDVPSQQHHKQTPFTVSEAMK